LGWFLVGWLVFWLVLLVVLPGGCSFFVVGFLCGGLVWCRQLRLYLPGILYFSFGFLLSRPSWLAWVGNLVWLGWFPVLSGHGPAALASFVLTSSFSSWSG
jgi:hypothetical protein